MSDVHFVNVNDDTYTFLKKISEVRKQPIPELLDDIIMGFILSTEVLQIILRSEEDEDGKE